MKVDHNLCIACGQCIDYCPMEAITVAEFAEIDQDACIECHICARTKACPVGALQIEELEWPRSLRSSFSDVLNPHKNTGVAGRGTEEMKTNDVTARLKKGRVGVAIELGRPGLGVTFRDVEKMAMAVARHGVEFEVQNPVDALMTDKATGKLMPEVLNEKVLSAIVEFEVERQALEPILRTILDTAGQLETVFSLCAATPMDDDNPEIPIDPVLEKLGISRWPNGKTNVGLGKPWKEC